MEKKISSVLDRFTSYARLSLVEKTIAKRMLGNYARGYSWDFKAMEVLMKEGPVAIKEKYYGQKGK